jgi:hypothetical protein
MPAQMQGQQNAQMMMQMQQMIHPAV